MGKKSRKRPDRKKKDAAAATAAATAKQPDEPLSKAAIEELLRAAAAQEPGAVERWKKYASGLPKEALERAMIGGPRLRDGKTRFKGLRVTDPAVHRLPDRSLLTTGESVPLLSRVPQCSMRRLRVTVGGSFHGVP